MKTNEGKNIIWLEVKNKTIIGLKFNRIKNGVNSAVKNKTIIGLK